MTIELIEIIEKDGPRTVGRIVGRLSFAATCFDCHGELHDVTRADAEAWVDLHDCSDTP